MIDYNSEYIHLPATLDEARMMPADDLRKLMADAETSPYAMMLVLPTIQGWFDTEVDVLEPELVA